MKILAAIIAILAVAALSEEAKLEPLVIKTLDGMEYQAAVISRLTPSSISFSYQDGTATLALAKLTPELQKRFNYDQVAAVRFEADQAATNSGRAMVLRAAERDRQLAIRKSATKTAREVESDPRAYLEKPMLLSGKIEVSSSYYGFYDRAERTHLAFRFNDETGDIQLYTPRDSGELLRQLLIKTGKPQSLTIKAVIQKKRFEPNGVLTMELLEVLPALE